MSDLHLPSRFITLSEMSLPTASAAAPPIRNECKAISSGLRRDFAIPSLSARRARPYLTTLARLSNRPYLTTLTELPNRYEARGACSGRLRKHDISTNLRATTTRLPSRATSIREPRLMPARVRFESVPSHISVPQTHLDVVDLSLSTVIQLHALGITARSTYALPTRIVIYFLCYRVSASRHHDAVLCRL